MQKELDLKELTDKQLNDLLDNAYSERERRWSEEKDRLQAEAMEKYSKKWLLNPYTNELFCVKFASAKKSLSVDFSGIKVTFGKQGGREWMNIITSDYTEFWLGRDIDEKFEELSPEQAMALIKEKLSALELRKLNTITTK